MRQLIVENLQYMMEKFDVVRFSDRIGVEEGPVEDLLEGGAVGCGLEL